MSDDAILDNYERIGVLRGFVRKPRLLDSGNVVQFFVPSDSADADLALMLGTSKMHDCEVAITIHLLKDASGADLKKAPAPAREDNKVYAALAAQLYKRGFFRSSQVHAAILKATGQKPAPTDAGMTPTQWGSLLAMHLAGKDGMGHVPPSVLVDWAERYEVAWLLPPGYKAEAGD